MRILAASASALVAFSVLPSNAQQTPAPHSPTDTITVRLSNFAFAPDHLRLKAGVPLRLRLENASNGGHDFSAPAFFAASLLPPGSPALSGGAVAVSAHQTLELDVMPRTPGTYRLECTHFLHSLFGMHGTIEVTP
ncbi:MAG TPA: cupredoxin domain-containing protein [Rhodopila sp.]|jgi:uncharacterized cupredoxin-like copper-binding protein